MYQVCSLRMCTFCLFSNKCITCILAYQNCKICFGGYVDSMGLCSREGVGVTLVRTFMRLDLLCCVCATFCSLPMGKAFV